MIQAFSLFLRFYGLNNQQSLSLTKSYRWLFGYLTLGSESDAQVEIDSSCRRPKPDRVQPSRKDSGKFHFAAPRSRGRIRAQSGEVSRKIRISETGCGSSGKDD